MVGRDSVFRCRSNIPLRRFIINDTYRSELCLLYPPHLIAIAAIYLTLILHLPTRATLTTLLPSGSESQADAPQEQPSTTPAPRRSSRQAVNASSDTPKKPQDPIAFLAELNVSLPLVATIAQEIISLYSLWDRYKEDVTPDASSRSGREQGQAHSPFTSGSAGAGGGSGSPSKRSAASRSGSLHTLSGSNVGTPVEVKDDANVDGGWGDGNGNGNGNGSVVTPVFLSGLLMRMRESRIADMAHPASGRPIAINKMLERTLAAG